MNKVFTLLIVIFCIQVQAQEDKINPFRGHIIAGVNFAQIDGDMAWGYNKVGLYSGVGVSSRFSKKINIQFSALYSAKGAFSSPNQPYTNTRINYIEFPVTVDINIFRKFFINPGIYYARLLSAQNDNTGWGMSNIEPFLQRYDWGIKINFEYRFNATFALQTCFSYSFLPITKPNLNSPFFIYTAPWFNNCLTFALQVSLF
jgi:outer membrane receptor for Fe3+-dicitrate